MVETQLKILLVDDEEKFLSSIAQRLTLLGAETLKASSGHQAIEIAQNAHLDLAIVDLQMPDMDGLVTIAKLKELQPDLRSVLLTGHGNEKVKQATEALDAGYFEKDAMGGFWNFIKNCHKEGNVVVIRPSAAKFPANDHQDEDNFIRSSRIELIPSRSYSDQTFVTKDGSSADRSSSPAGPLRIIGETQAMQHLRRDIKRFAALDCSLIIYGETGVGKELAARSIHESSVRREQRFIAINCNHFSNDLMVEEFLDIAKNATSGSLSSVGPEPGATILLDQIENMSIKMQSALIKILDRKREASQEDPEGVFDLRILAASHQDLRALVNSGEFREELYYRLNIVELTIPPLRNRRDDIAPLTSFFINRFNKEFGKSVTGTTDDVATLLHSYDFPGNVRELEYIVERAVIMAEGKTLETSHLPERSGILIIRNLRKERIS